MSLISAADNAYPLDYSAIPKDTKVILGYVGRQGYTPHVWTLAEVQDVRNRGYEWWPIVVGISQGATNAADGHICAQEMIAQAPKYSVTKDQPVIIDIEPNAYWADPAGARACRDAYKADMHAAGYPQAFAYGTVYGVFDWVADWTNVKPTSLPAGCIGIQYGGGQNFDVSVFDSSLLVIPVPPSVEDIELFILRVDVKTVPTGTQWPGDFLSDGTVVKHIIDGESEDAYANMGLKLALVSYKEFLTYKNVTQ